MSIESVLWVLLSCFVIINVGSVMMDHDNPRQFTTCFGGFGAFLNLIAAVVMFVMIIYGLVKV